MIVRQIDTTTVATTPISDDASMRHRDKELTAVMDILRSLVGENVLLEHRADGAPLLDGYNISISHSRKLAVVAIDKERPIGIDAEEWRPTLLRVAPKFLSRDELSMFQAPDQILAAWTIKEAVYKLMGSEAVDFIASIAIAAAMDKAMCLNHQISLHGFDVGDTHITLATIDK